MYTDEILPKNSNTKYQANGALSHKLFKDHNEEHSFKQLSLSIQFRFGMRHAHCGISRARCFPAMGTRQSKQDNLSSTYRKKSVCRFNTPYKYTHTSHTSTFNRIVMMSYIFRQFFLKNFICSLY